ncbi:MAG: DUF3021 domain-containing protein [Lachnospiraceae bacterium]|nr:DUF3021 domain-containing protein [Lachnospiraceae bacterium]
MDKSNKKKLSGFERYLIEEIGVEFKACLYFFCILFFYSVYKLVGGSFHANIIYMAEMILLTYAMCYVQIYLLKGFDEGEHFGWKEFFFTMLCGGIYTYVSWLGGWFDQNTGVTAGFFLYVVFFYFCGFLVYKMKRNLDAKMLNDDLKAFQERRIKNE